MQKIGEFACSCAGEPDPVCIVCENDPCVCDSPPKKMIKIKLSDGKVRQFDSMVKTSFWSPTGVPISAAEFIEQLFGDLPGFFQNEDELRKLWSLPGTRRKLLEELSEKGYSGSQLDDLRKLVQGENSDLYDILKLCRLSRRSCSPP